MRDMKRFFSYMGKYKFHYWMILIITLIAESSLQILYSYVTKQTLNAIEFQDMQLFRTAVIICAVIVLLRCLFPYLRYFQIKLVRKMVYELKLKLYEKLLRMNMKYYGDTHSGAALKTLNWDANSLKESWFSHVYWVLGKIVLVTSSIITMYIYSPMLTYISLAISLITAFVSIKINKSIKKCAKKVQGRSAKLAALLGDIISGFATLKLNSGAEIVLRHFNEENKEASKQEKSRVRMTAFLEMATFLLGIIGSFGTIVAGSMLVFDGTMNYGTVMAVVTLQMGVSNSMQRFGGSLSAFTTSIVRASRVFDFMELEQEENIGWNMNAENNVHFKAGETKSLENNENAVYISNLNFSYDSVLKDEFDGNLSKYENLNCEKMVIKQNEKIMLVGESGCGKSTLLKLLQGFYPVGHGMIGLFGKDISEYPLEQLRSMITYVPQDSYLFEGTIAENIAYGCESENIPGRVPDRESIIKAATLASADEFIRLLPDGYDTYLNAGGLNLSGGQRQRIAIARALMKDSPVVLMDEPSSALDTHSEKLVLQAMDALMNNKTVIMVSHRITGVEKFDRVITMG